MPIIRVDETNNSAAEWSGRTPGNRQGEMMKTYKTHGRCVKALDSALPVRTPTETLWTSRGALVKMLPIEDEVAFAPNSLGNGGSGDSRFDRVFSLVCDHETWGVRCELSRGFPADWPQIEIYESLREARKALAAVIAQYDSDLRWRRVVR